MDFKNFPPVVFVSGTGTDVGKSHAVGWLAKELIRQGYNCITQKFVQTGNIGRSEDIELHRKIMGIDLLPEDKSFLTCPQIFSYPCSPDLAARLEDKEIDFNKIERDLSVLKQNHEIVIMEGAGGLMVPLKGEYLTIDYIKDKRLPVIMVISGELGSINHALLSLFALKTYNINLYAVIYNPFFDKDSIIVEDSRMFLKTWIKNNFSQVHWWDMNI